MTVALAGDTMLGREVGRALPVRATPAGRGPSGARARERTCSSSTSSAASRLGASAFANSASGSSFRAPPVAAERLADIGVDCVTLANNHALDFGSEALRDTLDHLRAVGIAAVGAGGDEAAARAPVVLQAGGLRVRVVAVSDHPSEYAARADRPGVAFADLAGASVPGWLATALRPGPTPTW